MEDLFFVAAKAGWALLRPDTLLLLMAAAGLVLLRRRPRLGRALTGGALAVLALIALLPLQSLLLAPLEARFPRPDPPPAAIAGILLLGGSEDLGAAARSGRPEVNDAGDRYLAALALARRHPEVPVLFAGGGAQLRPGGGEARMARRLLTGAGLDPARLILEDRSRNTAENAANALALRPDRDGPWLLVTSAWHMPRAMGAFCAAGWTDLLPWPADHRSRPFRPGWDPAGNLDALTRAAREWIGLLAYRLTGRSDVLFPAGCPPQ